MRCKRCKLHIKSFEQNKKIIKKNKKGYKNSKGCFNNRIKQIQIQMMDYGYDENLGQK